MHRANAFLRRSTLALDGSIKECLQGAGRPLPAPITLAPGFKDVTAAQQQDQQLQRRLQQDSIQLAGKTVYINPFLYWRRFDSNTDRWLREPGQLNEDQIQQNRGRFYPELEWALLDPSDQEIKDGAVEMFLKSSLLPEHAQQCCAHHHGQMGDQGNRLVMNERIRCKPQSLTARSSSCW